MKEKQQKSVSPAGSKSKKKNSERDKIINLLIEKRRNMLSKQNCDSCGERCAD
jgi:hypothetical protein